MVAHQPVECAAARPHYNPLTPLAAARLGGAKTATVAVIGEGRDGGVALFHLDQAVLGVVGKGRALVVAHFGRELLPNIDDKMSKTFLYKPLPNINLPVPIPLLQ